MGELIDRSRRVFGELTTFERAYPQLEDAVVEWTEEGSGAYRYNRGEPREFDQRVSMKEYGDLIRCSNSLCRQGGFELGLELSSVVRKKEMVTQGYKTCLGSEGSPKLRRVYRKCVNGIRFRITVTYKSVSAESQAPPS